MERHDDGSLLLAPESVDEVIAETSERPLNGDEFLDALERLVTSEPSVIARRDMPHYGTFSTGR